MSESEIRFHTLPSADDVNELEDLSETDHHILSIYDGINGRGYTKPNLKRAQELLQKFDEQTCLVALSEDDPDDITAVANVDFNHGNQKAWIAGIATHPEYQGLGIGRNMMKFIEQESRSRALAAVALRSVPSAIGFYIQAGYDLEEDQTPATQHEPVMVKSLDIT